MDSKQTDESQSKKQSVHDWLPDDGKSRGKKPADGNKSKFIGEILREDIIEEPPVVGVDTANSTANITNTDTIGSMDTMLTVATENRKDTEDAALREQAGQTASRRTSSKQRKESLEEYRQAFLTVPKLEDRKPVFISREVRDELDEIARKLGGRRMSVSGFIENLARHHLEIYREDVEMWKKL